MTPNNTLPVAVLANAKQDTIHSPSSKKARVVRATRVKKPPKRPPKYDVIDEIEAEKKERRKKDFRPSEDLPTVEGAKQILVDHYKEKGYDVKVQNRGGTFLVIFGNSETEKWSGSELPKGLGPYGLYSVDHGWFTVKSLVRKSNEAKGKKSKR